MKKFFTILLVSIVASVSLTSCENDTWGEYYYSPLLGSWRLVYVNDEPVTGYEEEQFTFYDDGTGIFGQYSPQLVWNTYAITWDCYFPNNFDNYLNVYTWNGDTWTYRYRIEGNGLYAQLVLYDTLYGNTLVFNSL